jgi:hypothetical protein
MHSAFSSRHSAFVCDTITEAATMVQSREVIDDDGEVLNAEG